MKKNIFIIILSLFLITGCSLLKKDAMENIDIITTIYPLEYITNYLYGNNSIINSIYPDDTNIDTYKLTDKQYKDNSTKDLFIYLGSSNDSDIAVELINRNKKLKLIDAGIEYKQDISEIWLNPSNLLKVSQNIKNGLDEYIDNTFLKQEINDRYLELKLILSEVDANIKTTIENAKKKTIYTNSKCLLFLEKYGLKVYIVNKDYELYEKNLALLKEDIENSKTKYFYYLEDTIIDTSIQSLIDEKKLTAIEFRNLKNITDEERNLKKDYISITNSNIENLKKELY